MKNLSQMRIYEGKQEKIHFLGKGCFDIDLAAGGEWTAKLESNMQYEEQDNRLPIYEYAQECFRKMNSANLINMHLEWVAESRKFEADGCLTFIRIFIPYITWSLRGSRRSIYEILR